MLYDKAPNFSSKAKNNSFEIFWHKGTQEKWLEYEESYWSIVKPQNMELEQEIEQLNHSDIENMDIEGFYHFLYEKYFVWKYTAPNRLATTRKSLAKHQKKLQVLKEVKNEIFTFEKTDILSGLIAAKKIKGLGVAGASGLLSILFPKYFATVDQFLVKSLAQVSNLSSINVIKNMNPESLTEKNGVLLISICRNKANELNEKYKTDYWTPRKIDKVLWGVRN